jgi:hypothetical protein
MIALRNEFGGVQMDKKTTATKQKPASQKVKDQLKKEAPKTQDAPEVKAQTQTKESPPAKDTPMLSLSALQAEIAALKEIVLHHTEQIAELYSTPKKRKSSRNGKVQIKDKQTGNIYPSKNNAYQTLLKAGELKELVDKGIFGSEPEKNNFGWFALVRAWPDRFEEVKTATPSAS